MLPFHSQLKSRIPKLANAELGMLQYCCCVDITFDLKKDLVIYVNPIFPMPSQSMTSVKDLLGSNIITVGCK